MNKVILRTCIATREKLPQGELIRVVKTPENKVKIENGQKIMGRGAYIKRSEEAIQLVKKKRLLEKALKVKVDDSIYDELMKLL